MLDLLILFVLACAFAGGFYCGTKYQTLNALLTTALNALMPTRTPRR